MPQTEQEQQQSPLRPGADARGTDCGEKHQRVDLEAFLTDVGNRFLSGEPSTEHVGRHVQNQRQTINQAKFSCESSGTQESTTDQRENQLCVHSKNAAMLMAMTFMPGLVIRAFKQTLHNSSLLGSRLPIALCSWGAVSVGWLRSIARFARAQALTFRSYGVSGVIKNARHCLAFMNSLIVLFKSFTTCC
ncbi:hypothetical protein D3C79_745340 [compost metagenome]